MEQIAGAVVAVITLLDIFLTVLYARAGTALPGRLVCLHWMMNFLVWGCVALGRVLPRRSQ